MVKLRQMLAGWRWNDKITKRILHARRKKKQGNWQIKSSRWIVYVVQITADELCWSILKVKTVEPAWFDITCSPDFFQILQDFWHCRENRKEIEAFLQFGGRVGKRGKKSTFEIREQDWNVTINVDNMQKTTSQSGLIPTRESVNLKACLTELRLHNCG